MTSGEVIIITGASSGIGEAAAELFGKEGYKVVLAARRIGRLETIATKIIKSGGDALPVKTDVINPESVENLINVSVKHWGKIDILFNNAGTGRVGWLENLDPIKEIDPQVNVNLLGTIYCSRSVLPHMIERRHGHIINMSSIAGLVALPTYTIYCASKFALRGFSQALRREVGIWGIKVSTIFPGGVISEFGQKSGVQRRRSGISTPKFLRLKVDDVAQAVLRVARRPKQIVVIPWLMRYSIWLNNLAPAMVDRIIERRFVLRERGMERNL
jgi:NADP-dependent 3-hydroxy acid dehydrogenase YdfG